MGDRELTYAEVGRIASRFWKRLGSRGEMPHDPGYQRGKNAVRRAGGRRRLSLSLEQGEVVGLIGPNGAGKTTVFNVVTACTRLPGYCNAGRPRYHRDAADLVTRLGIGRTFQNIRLFSRMSVIENILVSLHWRLRANIFDAFFLNRKYRVESSYETPGDGTACPCKLG